MKNSDTLTYTVLTLTCGCGFVASGASALGADNAMVDHLALRFIDVIVGPRSFCGFPRMASFAVTVPKQSKYTSAQIAPEWMR